MALAAPAHAAVPGVNGKIAFSRSGEIYVMNPDGSWLTRLTNNAAYDGQPAWSPDGSKIAFVSDRDGFEEIYSMSAAGTGQTRLTNNSTPDRGPTWSPDGGKIAFASGDNYLSSTIYSMNADGSGQVAVTSHPNPRTGDSDPAWSSTGKIAFSRYWTQDDSSGAFIEYIDLFTVDPDGSDLTQVTHMPGYPVICGGSCVPEGQATQPAWSPDGSKLAFTFTRYNRHANAYQEIYAIQPDGSGQTVLTNTSEFPPPVGRNGPAWSPDGTKIAFRLFDHQQSTGSIWTMNADGTSHTALTQPVYPVSDVHPDWQPIPYAGYPRPKGATPMHVSLVPAYRACSSPNSTHGSPLAFASCTPPMQASDYLTVGTPPQDPANSIGSVTAKTIATDVQLVVSVTDVRNMTSLTDYTGELQTRLPLRITDKNSFATPGSDASAATTQDAEFSFTVPCAGTSDTTIGSLCSITTTANAVVPGAVTANLRTIWALGQIGVYDGGSDGVASTTGDNTLFMDEGIFVP